MPSVEIVCMNQQEASDYSDMPFAVVAEDQLVSHRGPKPLFQADFDLLRGYIYHLGGPEFFNESGQAIFTAYNLLSERCRDQEEARFLEFKDEYTLSLKVFVQRLLQSSPSRRLLFTSDYQFGPPQPQRSGEITCETFWQTHGMGQLLFNTSYEIVP